MSRKTIQALAFGALLTGSLPALAAHDSWNDRREVRAHRQDQVMVAPHRSPAAFMVPVNQPVYTYRPSYVQAAPYYHAAYVNPAPVFYPTPSARIQREPNVLGAGLGAAVGAVIGSQVGSGHGRAATSALGAAIGGMIGSQF
jgi:hypothetical protein